ncbi:MAG: hypothetical protein ACP5XB_17795 [Isosphaeraceae bacterium]
MNVSGRGLLASSRIAAIFALLIGGIVWPQTARAGCSGHYINSRSGSPDSLARLELLGLDEHVPALPAKSPNQRPKPCSGAFCSGHPAVPVPAVPPLPSHIRGELALPDSLRLAADRGRFGHLLTNEPLRPALFPSSIFHPPR